MYGRLIYVYGAMGSAKTAELLIEAYAHEEKGFKVCCIKPQRDTRDKTIKSRAGDLEFICWWSSIFNTRTNRSIKKINYR